MRIPPHVVHVAHDVRDEEATDAAIRRVLELPSHPFLGAAQVDEVADALVSALGPHAEPVTDRRG